MVVELEVPWELVFHLPEDCGEEDVSVRNVCVQGVANKVAQLQTKLKKMEDAKVTAAKGSP